MGPVCPVSFPFCFLHILFSFLTYSIVLWKNVISDKDCSNKKVIFKMSFLNSMFNCIQYFMGRFSLLSFDIWSFFLKCSGLTGDTHKHNSLRARLSGKKAAFRYQIFALSIIVSNKKEYTNIHVIFYPGTLFMVPCLTLDSCSTSHSKRRVGNSVISPLLLAHSLPCCTRWLLHKDGKHCLFPTLPSLTLTTTKGDSQPILSALTKIMSI